MPFPTNKVIITGVGPNTVAACVVNKPKVKVSVKRPPKQPTVALAKQPVYDAFDAPSQNFVYRALRVFDQIMAACKPRIFVSNPLATATTALHQHALALTQKPGGIQDDSAIEHTGEDLKQNVIEVANKPATVRLLDMFSALLKTSSERRPAKVALYHQAVEKVKNKKQESYSKYRDIQKTVYVPPPEPPKVVYKPNEIVDVVLPDPPSGEFGVAEKLVREVNKIGSPITRADEKKRKELAAAFKTARRNPSTKPRGQEWLSLVERTMLTSAGYLVEQGCYIKTC